MFPKNCWYAVTWAAELGDKPLACRVAGEAIVLYRGSDGRPLALADRCCHRHAPLSRGRIEGDELRCGYHGLRFNAEGRCTEIPGQSSIPDKFRVKAYTVAEQHGWIWVWLGSATPALDLLPPSRFTDPKWRGRTGQLDWAVNYQLLNDNLCDFSHLTYVHASTFGQFGEEIWARSQPRITDIERGARFDRWLVNLPIPPYLGTGMCDIWTTYDYLVPGILLLESEVHHAGTADRARRGRPPADAEVLHAGYSAQAATPLDEHHTRYLFGVAVRASEPAERLDIYHAMTLAAFEEDHAMIGAQHQNIMRAPDVPMNMTTHDKGVARLRKLITEMAA